MFIVKYVKPSERGAAASVGQGRSDASQINQVSVVAEILQGLNEPLSTRPALKKSVSEVTRRLVAEEARFVTGVKNPQQVAAFRNHELDRVADFVGWVSDVVGDVLQSMPADAAEPGVLTVQVPLIALLRDGNGLVQRLVEKSVGRHFDGSQLALGAGLATAVVARMCHASKVTEAQAREKPSRVKWPKHFDVPAEELVTLFLRGTALAALLLSPVSVSIPDRVRMEHMLITAGAGHGKTQTLQHMIACDLDRPKLQHVGMVVIDSQGDLINRISRLACFADNDRLLVIDASDIEHPVGLNVFDLGGRALASAAPGEREQAMNATVGLCEYVIGGLFGAEMTETQGTVFRFLIRLMLSIPGATIHTLRQCLEEPKNFAADMARQPETARQFLTQEFTSKGFGPTRKQILRRLYGVLQNETFERMFGAKKNKLDLYDALNAGRVVVCNTSREFLQDECKVFGRYCIAVAMKAAFDRARLAPEARRTSYLYIDEASDYFDANVEQLLVQARKYKLGLVLAHQALEQMPGSLSALVMSNTSIKLAGGASAKDARALAPELRTTPEFILGQEKTMEATRFAAFVRNVTPAAVSWQIPFGSMERIPVMSDSERVVLIARNRREVS